jgi:hypothetical protein
VEDWLAVDQVLVTSQRQIDKEANALPCNPCRGKADRMQPASSWHDG